MRGKLRPAAVPFLESAGPKVLYYNISFTHQLFEKTLSLLLPKVEGDALLVTSDDGPPHRRLTSWLGAPMTHGIALAGRFDLDDLGTHVSEQLAAERSCDQRAEFQHAKVGESAGW